ncbi:MAG: hypothetical protein IV108_07270 [Burkholderiales bacterium]|nr:hypothetical protein [Burkholderiales bacterium]
MNDRKLAMPLVIIASIFTLLPSLSSAGQLISNEEAKLPAAAKFAARGGLTRGPGVKFVSPTDGQIKGPFDMKFQFEPRGGSKIDPASVKVTYLKAPLVDLTERVKPFVSAKGIDMSKVEIPPGEHDIKVEVTDDAGRKGSTVVSLVIAK